MKVNDDYYEIDLLISKAMKTITNVNKKEKNNFMHDEWLSVYQLIPEIETVKITF